MAAVLNLKSGSILFLLFVLLACLTISSECIGQVPFYYSPQAGDSVQVYIYNIDDQGYVYVGSKQVFFWDHARDSGWIDITYYLSPGRNYVTFKVKNLIRRWTYGFKLRKNGQTLYNDSCGTRAVYGCNGDAWTLGWVFSHTVPVDISSACSISLSPATLPNGVAGQPYSAKITASGGTAPYVFSIAGPTPHLTITSDGLLTGTPTANGTFNFTVSVKDKTGCTASRAYSLQVGNMPPPVKVGVTNVSKSSGIANQTLRTTGVQWIDYNGDGRLDLFMVGTNGTVLFKNVDGKTFANVTAQAKIGNNGRSARGASWADIDNDGDLDVVIANVSGNPTLLLNNHGVFADISSKLTTGMAAPSLVGSTQACLFVDINNDKDIDLLVVRDGAPNQLWKKTGWNFEEIATKAGVALTSSGRAAVASDFNSDGYQDIFVVNYNHQNKLYLNNTNGTFTDISTTAGFAFSGGSVQAAVADYDRDQDMDLFVVNNTGSSVLYKNLGNLKFSIATPTVLQGPKKGAAAAFFDVDLDGNQDLILAQTTGGNKLFLNKGSGQFQAADVATLNDPDSPTSVAIGDFNHDGKPDIMIGDGDESSDRGDSLYQNSGSGGNNFLELTLIGTSANRSAIGAKVVVQTGSQYQSRVISSGNGQSQESLPMIFGLGSVMLVDTIYITWPGGAKQTVQNVPANSRRKVQQP